MYGPVGVRCLSLWMLSWAVREFFTNARMDHGANIREFVFCSWTAELLQFSEWVFRGEAGCGSKGFHRSPVGGRFSVGVWADGGEASAPQGRKRGWQGRVGAPRSWAAVSPLGGGWAGKRGGVLF
ncbi:MAG: hypothetical protein D6732_18845, partial [Methanobacteriota archaeon]